MDNQAVDKDMDLPLTANVEEIRVRHYMMQLLFDFDEATVRGEALLFCQSPSTIQNNEEHKERIENTFEMILDHRHLDFTEVSEVIDSSSEFELIMSDFKNRKDLSLMKSCFQKPLRPLKFLTEEWSLRIWKESVSNATEFPGIIKITWKTQKQAKSLMWRLDQEGNKCVFTAAASVNNRSLFPCQEPPTAMASWQCLIQASNPELCILCTGDINPQPSKGQQYFYTQMILPMSTFAVAIGSWKCADLQQVEVCNNGKINSLVHSRSKCKLLHEPYPCHVARGDPGPAMPCRLFGPPSMLITASKLWSLYLPACLDSAYELLGPHPFQKLDICVVPRCYSGLGLASPNLMFISQSLINATDGGLMVKVAHEIAHNWFGLLIGSKDWTEEWLTEVSTVRAPL